MPGSAAAPPPPPPPPPSSSRPHAAGTSASTAISTIHTHRCDLIVAPPGCWTLDLHDSREQAAQQPHDPAAEHVHARDQRRPVDDPGQRLVDVRGPPGDEDDEQRPEHGA